MLLAYDSRLRNRDRQRSSTENWLTKAYLLLGDYQKVIEVAEKYPFPSIMDMTAQNHLFALAKLQQYDALTPTIEKYNKMGVYGRGMQKLPPFRLYNTLCNYLKILGQKDLQKQYAQQLMELVQNEKKEENYLLEMADAAIYLEDWEKAMGYLEQYQSQVDISGDFEVLSKLGVVYVQLRETKKVNELLAAFDTPKGEKKHRLYGKARILAALGKKEAALEALQTAFQLGRGFAWDNYHLDSFLTPLSDYPPFVKFVKPKG